MNEQLLGNMDEIEVRHLKSCHDSKLYQKLIRLPSSKIAHLKQFSFCLCLDAYPGGYTYVFPELAMNFRLIRKLPLTTITFYAAMQSTNYFYHDLVFNFVELIGSMELLEHIRWFENMPERVARAVGETAVAKFRQHFAKYFVNNSHEVPLAVSMREYESFLKHMHCTSADNETKTLVLAVNGKWCSDRTKDWQTCSSWRNVRVTVATFDEVKALPPA
jgi:hypothetical protein